MARSISLLQNEPKIDVSVSHFGEISKVVLNFQIRAQDESVDDLRLPNGLGELGWIQFKDQEHVILCEFGCVVCDQDNWAVCLQCREPFYLNTEAGSCVESCPQGTTYVFGDLRACFPESRNLAEQDCPSQQYWDEESTSCLACNTDCATCYGPLDRNCLTCPDGKILSHKHECIFYNNTPYGGTFTIDPLTGEAFSTVFTLKSSGWIEFSENLPLRYELLYRNVSGELISFSSATTLQTVLPSPAVGENKLDVVLRVSNAQNRVVEVSQQLTVQEPAVASQFLASLTNLLTSIENSDSSEEVVRGLTLINETVFQECSDHVFCQGDGLAERQKTTEGLLVRCLGVIANHVTKFSVTQKGTILGIILNLTSQKEYVNDQQTVYSMISRYDELLNHYIKILDRDELASIVRGLGRMSSLPGVAHNRAVLLDLVDSTLDRVFSSVLSRNWVTNENPFELLGESLQISLVKIAPIVYSSVLNMTFQAKEVIFSLQIPASLLANIAKDSDDSYVRLVAKPYEQYKNSSHGNQNSSPADHYRLSYVYKIEVITTDSFGERAVKEISKLSQPIIMTVPMLSMQADYYPECLYWNYLSEEWLTNGVGTGEPSGPHQISCSLSHLSQFYVQAHSKTFDRLRASGADDNPIESSGLHVTMFLVILWLIVLYLVQYIDSFQLKQLKKRYPDVTLPSNNRRLGNDLAGAKTLTFESAIKALTAEEKPQAGRSTLESLYVSSTLKNNKDDHKRGATLSTAGVDPEENDDEGDKTPFNKAKSDGATSFKRITTKLFPFSGLVSKNSKEAKSPQKHKALLFMSLGATINKATSSSTEKGVNSAIITALDFQKLIKVDRMEKAVELRADELFLRSKRDYLFEEHQYTTLAFKNSERLTRRSRCSLLFLRIVTIFATTGLLLFASDRDSSSFGIVEFSFSLLAPVMVNPVMIVLKILMTSRQLEKTAGSKKLKSIWREYRSRVIGAYMLMLICWSLSGVGLTSFAMTFSDETQSVWHGTFGLAIFLDILVVETATVALKAYWASYLYYQAQDEGFGCVEALRLEKPYVMHWPPSWLKK